LTAASRERHQPCGCRDRRIKSGDDGFIWMAGVKPKGGDDGFIWMARIKSAMTMKIR
jgi:hypothetical protein